MKQQTVERGDNLELYLGQIANLFDIGRIISKTQKKQDIIAYYVLNKLTYRLFYSWQGFYHSGISYDGKRKKADFIEQARIIGEYIEDTRARKVLELGCGLGPNSAFLARNCPEVKFDAIDLASRPLKRFTKIPNLRFYSGDYHDLRKFEDHSYDIVFAIESLCYSTDKAQVLREAKKKLRNGGIFIIFDLYQRNRANPLSHAEEIMWELITKGVAANKFECEREVEDYMRKEYSIAEAKDLSFCILPSFERQESLARPYFNHPAFARAVNVLLPFDIVKNWFVVLLIPTSIRREIMCYHLHVLRNDG